MARTSREDAIEATKAFAGRIKALGFIVYLAEKRRYGFITDETESRVLTFSLEHPESLGGSYHPPSWISGTGWRMDKNPDDLKTKEDVLDALYADPPDWLVARGKGWKRLSTVADYLGQYQTSSRFSRV